MKVIPGIFLTEVSFSYNIPIETKKMYCKVT